MCQMCHFYSHSHYASHTPSSTFHSKQRPTVVLCRTEDYYEALAEACYQLIWSVTAWQVMTMQNGRSKNTLNSDGLDSGPRLIPHTGSGVSWCLWQWAGAVQLITGCHGEPGSSSLNVKSANHYAAVQYKNWCNSRITVICTFLII